MTAALLVCRQSLFLLTVIFQGYCGLDLTKNGNLSHVDDGIVHVLLAHYNKKAS
jgi:hypothetical protein